MRTDLHIHTEFSCDSEADMEQYILKAINEGRSKREISSFLNISLDEIDSILDSNIND